MKRATFQHHLGYLRFQRNILATLALAAALTLIITSTFLFTKRERILVVPPIVEREFWVEGHAISPAYLEQFGAFLGQLLLNKSAHSAPTQRQVLLRHTDPSFVGTLRKKLLTEEELLKQQGASYAFYPRTVQAQPDRLQVLIKGDRSFFVSDKRISQTAESYLLSFHYLGGKLLLQEVTAGEGSHD